MKGYISEYQVFGAVVSRIPLKYTSTVKGTYLHFSVQCLKAFWMG